MEVMWSNLHIPITGVARQPLKSTLPRHSLSCRAQVFANFTSAISFTTSSKLFSLPVHLFVDFVTTPYALWFWFGLEFQILLEIICQGIFYHIQMIHEVWMTRTPFIISHCLERPMTQFVRVPPYEIWVFLTSLIFFCKKR